MTDEEQWRPVVGYEESYHVSDRGCTSSPANFWHRAGPAKIFPIGDQFPKRETVSIDSRAEHNHTVGVRIGDRISWGDRPQDAGRVTNAGNGFYVAELDNGQRVALRQRDIKEGGT